ncbi:MAG TPA: PhzF family phenazine biosynthesis protein, partial [Streptosporangiaceae bacterium]|nr:PhzF family phenazine biosynthesis protein [Streptosporangiaceae bacterium]
PLWLPFLIADVFTGTPLEGNQLGIFPEADDLDADLMQRAAREMNFSETVFFQSPKGGGDAHVRIFTTASELPFAGHPTLGSAFVLAERLGKDLVTLETGVGLVPVEFRGDGFGEMRQRFPDPEPYQRVADLLEAVGVETSELPVEVYENGPRHAYVMLPSEEAVASLKPDMTKLADLDASANCFAGAGTQWLTRMFAPGHGVVEDPATGSAAGPLVVHLARNGRVKYGERIEIRQGEQIHRPSRLYARAEHDTPGSNTAHVGGHTVVVARGEYRLR